MKRSGLIALVALALVAFTAPAAAKSVYNEQYREVVVEAGWYSGDWGDDTIVSGYVGARHRKGADTGEMYFSYGIGTEVTCDAGTPGDPGDDYVGYEWLNTEGWGPAAVSVEKSFTLGSAQATLEAWTSSYSECDWYWTENGGGEPTTVEVSLDLVGDGPLVRSKSGYSFHIPGEYNEHSKSSSTYRTASGTVTVDGTPYPTQWGQIGEYRWSTHVRTQ